MHGCTRDTHITNFIHSEMKVQKGTTSHNPKLERKISMCQTPGHQRTSALLSQFARPHLSPPDPETEPRVTMVMDRLSRECVWKKTVTQIS